ncbi:MAG: M23 family metallopeptidase [Clostridium sp.]|nr:M23 family metallopeptidase [Clostridium sp.]
MKSNNSDKVKNFFRKEGFYFVLFICLCVIATVAVFTINKNSTASKNNSAKESVSLNVDEKKSLEPSESANNERIQNAERVENYSNDIVNGEEVAEAIINEETPAVSEADNEATDIAESEDTAAVMSESENGIIFSVPLEATVSRSFGEMIEVKKTDEEQIIMTRRGVDLQAPVGSVVKCAAEGQVQEIGSNSENGNYIVVAHANGLKTKYANLDPEVYVSEGDMVTEGQELGIIGNSSLVFTSDICGDVLNLQVEDANGKSVDPSSYFNF